MIHSPTSTDRWTSCPFLWALSREGWQPRYLGYGDIARMRGQAFHAGAAGIHLGHWPNESAACEIQLTLDAMHEHGQTWLPGVTPIETDDTLVRSALEAYAVHDVWRAWDIRDVELAMPEYGNTRIDVGIKQADGYAVIDLKYKRRVPLAYAKQPQHEADAEALVEFASDAKMYHHCWAYESHLARTLGDRVPAGPVMVSPHRVVAYWIVMVVSEPKFRVLTREYAIEQSRMDAWLVSAKTKWSLMDAQDANVASMWEGPHYGRYGACQFAEACLEMGRDRQRMLRAYVQVPKRIGTIITTEA